MYRTNTCGELRIADAGKQVTLAGWVQRIRNFGGMIFIDLRDRYGITQLVFNPEHNLVVSQNADGLGREFVIAASGKVVERSNKNKELNTGEIEILVDELNVLNASLTPPFTIEDETDGGDELRMKYRYLDLRRKPVQQNLLYRHKVAQAVRGYLDLQGFADVETPHLIKTTPEGARDFVVPSRMNPGQFYALPQSPQTFKQLLMVSGFDRYYQIVRCFRDEDLRADRQPEFTQIDCEMAFVEREDVLQMFEGMVKFVFKQCRNIDLPDFPRMSYDDAMMWYGNDKPDIRFEMKFVYLKQEPFGCALLEHDSDNAGFKVFDDAEIVVGICAKGCAEYSRKQLDELAEFVKRPQIGATGLVYIKYNSDGTIKSSIDKFYSSGRLKSIAESFEAAAGDLILILAGEKNKTRKALSELRLEMGNRLGLRSKKDYKPLWVLDFPLLEWDEDGKRWNAMHHPFTSWRKEDDTFLETDPGKVKANAYDVVINGVEIGGGSIRIHNRENQMRMFKALGMSKEDAEMKFGFILNAFEFGAPPHGGIALGFDRFCSMTIANQENIRDFIAFPKNNMGRDMMLDAPSEIDEKQKKELGLK
ncbi:MAG TPA: aspartate--tRNA ligase [Chitinophagales bacterium]|nr:aspartate--tRNA ligase [Chitinophagales bacterium]